MNTKSWTQNNDIFPVFMGRPLDGKTKERNNKWRERCIFEGERDTGVRRFLRGSFVMRGWSIDTHAWRGRKKKEEEKKENKNRSRRRRRRRRNYKGCFKEIYIYMFITLYSVQNVLYTTKYNGKLFNFLFYIFSSLLSRNYEHLVLGYIISKMRSKIQP